MRRRRSARRMARKEDESTRSARHLARMSTSRRGEVPVQHSAPRRACSTPTANLCQSLGTPVAAPPIRAGGWAASHRCQRPSSCHARHALGSFALLLFKQPGMHLRCQPRPPAPPPCAPAPRRMPRPTPRLARFTSDFSRGSTHIPTHHLHDLQGCVRRGLRGHPCHRTPLLCCARRSSSLQQLTNTPPTGVLYPNIYYCVCNASERSS